MSLLKHYIKISWRNILKRKGQSIIGVVGLAMSILAFSFCLFVLDFFGEIDYQIPGYQKIVEIERYNEQKTRSREWADDGIQQLLQSDIYGIERIGIVNYDFRRSATCYFSLSEDEEIPYMVNNICVNEGIIDVFSIRIKTGSKKELFNSQGKVIIAESTARKVYGDISPIGKIIRIQEDVYTIEGIMEDLPVPNSLGGLFPVDFLFCISDPEVSSLTNSHIFAFIKDKKLIPEINKRFSLNNSQWGEYIPQIENKKITLITPQGEINPGAAIFISIAILLLLTGMINFLSINIGTFYNRNKELVLRKIIGSSTLNLFGLLFTELSILIGFAFLLTICLTEGLLPVILDNINFTQISFRMPTGLLIVFQLKYFFYIFSFCTLIAFLSILRLQKLSVMQGLKGTGDNRSKHFFRNCMLGFQFFVTVLFIGLTAIFHMQSRSVESGIMHTFPVEEQRRTFDLYLRGEEVRMMEQEIISQVSKHPGIEDILVMDDGLRYGRGYVYVTPSGNEYWCRTFTGENFIRFFHLSLLSGSNISGPDEILISKSFFEEIDDEEFNGYLQQGDNNYRIVGVVENFDIEFGNRKDPFFVITSENTFQRCYIKAYAGSEKTVKAHVEKVLRQWIPETLPLYLDTLETTIGNDKMMFRLVRNACSIFAIICLSLTLLGIYTAITLDTERRQKEVGIRKVNGATMKDIAFHFGKLYLYIFIVSSILAFPVFILIGTFMQNEANIVYNFRNPLFWIGLLMTIFLILLSIISYRLYKISCTNPAEVIKSE